jgi:hypothetical protein
MEHYSDCSEQLSIDGVLEADRRARSKANELLDAGLITGTG